MPGGDAVSEHNHYMRLLKQQKELRVALSRAPKSEQRVILIDLSRITEELSEIREQMGIGKRRPRQNFESRDGQVWRASTWEDSNGFSRRNGNGSPLRTIESNLMDTLGNPPSSTQRKEMMGALQTSIETITPTQYKYLIAHLSGQSGKAVALANGVTESTVSRVLSKAKLRLQMEVPKRTTLWQRKKLYTELAQSMPWERNSIYKALSSNMTELCALMGTAHQTESAHDIPFWEIVSAYSSAIMALSPKKQRYMEAYFRGETCVGIAKIDGVANRNVARLLKDAKSKLIVAVTTQYMIQRNETGCSILHMTPYWEQVEVFIGLVRTLPLLQYQYLSKHLRGVQDTEIAMEYGVGRSTVSRVLDTAKNSLTATCKILYPEQAVPQDALSRGAIQINAIKMNIMKNL